jgi:hypothetical protein
MDPSSASASAACSLSPNGEGGAHRACCGFVGTHCETALERCARIRGLKYNPDLKRSELKRTLARHAFASTEAPRIVYLIKRTPIP